MPFQPNIDDILEVGGIEYRFTGPARQGFPESRQGNHATVYQLRAPAGTKHALKVFTPRYRSPRHSHHAPVLLLYATIPGLQVAARTVLTPQRDAPLLNQVPQLAYAILMPWLSGITWQEYIQNGEPLTPDQCRIIALSLANLLHTMEQQGIAHCDLAGSNVMLPGLESSNQEEGDANNDRLSSAALVDFEHFYAPRLSQPEFPPASLAGYAPVYAAQGDWGPLADRFSGAVLIAEMLGWCDPRVRIIAHQNTFFYPGEMQTDTERFRVLHDVIKNRWGKILANTFSQAWYSHSPQECPAFELWYNQIGKVTGENQPQPQTFPAIEIPSIPSRPRLTQERSPENHARGGLASSALEPGILAQGALAQDNLSQAKDLLSRGQLDEAVSLLLAAYTRNPSGSAPLYAQALIQRGRKREAAGDLAGALSDYRAALAITPPGQERNNLDAKIASIASIPGRARVANPPASPGSLSTAASIENSGQPGLARYLIIAVLVAVLLIGTVSGLSYLLTRASQKNAPFLAPSETVTQLAFNSGTALPNTGIPQTGSTSAASLTPSPPQASPTPLPVLPTHQPGAPYSSQHTGHIVFTCTTGSGIQRICQIDSGGHGYTQLTTTAAKEGDAYPSFSPDGKSILFVSDRGGSGYEVYTMNADGSNPLQLTHGLADASSPSYSPDGNSIVFVVDQNQI
ncbi:MAG: hypothetical protein ACM3PY_21040, partial [Omnitrophica WOR_2 bacterium]